MELGSWALVNGPSLLGLLPLLIYIVLGMIMTKHMIVPLVIATVVGCIMSGNGAIQFGASFNTALGGLMGQIGVICLLGAGLGAVMNETGVTSTLCKWLINMLHIKTRKQAIMLMSIVVFVLSFVLGSSTVSCAVNFAFLMPIAAVFGVAPITMTVIQIFIGFAGMTLSPFSATNIACMEITGLTFPQFLTNAAIPYVIITLVCGLVLSFICDKRYPQGTNGEIYEAPEGGMEHEVTKECRNATIAFIITFVACVVYTIILKGGLAFTYFYMAALTVVISFAGRKKIHDTVVTFFKSAAGMLQLFFTLILLQVMLDTISAMGGFDALGSLCANAVGGTNGSVALMIIATIFGVFGVNGAAASQMLVINDVFQPMILSTGLSMGLWSFVLIMGSLPSNFLYPGATQWGIMGMCHCGDIKRIMRFCWITVAVTLVFSIVWCIIAGNIAG